MKMLAVSRFASLPLPLLDFLALMVGCFSIAHAAPIPKLFNTGVDDSGAPLLANRVDPHYKIIEIPDGVTVNTNAFTLTPGFPVGPWIAEGPISRWIAPRANQSTGSDPGNYVYRTTFDLTGFDPNKASITGRWVSDNGGVDILLNGQSLGLSNPGNFNGWTDANNFTLDAGFVGGTNTLDFVLNNAPPGVNPTGLRVEMRGTVELPSEPPSIVQQPRSGIAIVGDDFSFTVVAQGTSPLSYQWQRNGAPIAGATEATLALATVTLAQSGDYAVAVKNAFGTKTSDVARLTVLEPVPSLFNTGLKGDGTALDDLAVDPHYRLVVNPDGASTDAIVHDSSVFPIVSGPWLANSDTSKWIAPRGDTQSAAGGDYVYQTKFDLTGFDPLTALIIGRWTSDNAGLAVLLNGAVTGLTQGGNFNTLNSFTITNGFISGTNTLEFRVNNAGAGPTGLRVDTLRAGATKKTATGQEPPRIVAQPQSQVALSGETVILSVVADGAKPISYQWTLNGQNLTGKTTNSLVLAGLTTAQSGAYAVILSNAAGSVTSAAARLTVLDSVPGVFNTGVDDQGKPLADGAIDAHYRLIANAQAPSVRDAVVEDSTVFPIVAGPWVANSASSKWIGPQLDPNGAAGDYVFRATFDLSGFDPATARLEGDWATDNIGPDIILNGASTGIQNSSQFTSLSHFVITNGFRPGQNTIDFAVNNAGTDANPTGLRVENLRLGALKSGAAGPTIRSISDKGVAVTIAWSGGTAPYLVQKKTSLGSGDWFSVLTTSDTSVTVPREASTGFFRVQDNATTTVLPLSALLSGDAEIPPVTTPGRGLATLALEGNRLSYLISFSGLSGPATSGHIHGVADALNIAGVMVPFTGPLGNAGVVAGSAPLTADQISALKSGRTYVNFHTAANAGGEIRGQVVPLQLGARLTGAAEVPPITTSATGNATVTLIGSQAIFDITYASLSSDPTAAHLHGPANATQTAPPIIPLPTPTGTSGSIHGTALLTPQQLVSVLAGQTYLNIHTRNNGGGEIRGQVSLP